MPTVITRQHLAESAAQATGISVAACYDVLSAVLDAITDGLENGNEIGLRRFGSFKPVHRRKRLARVPAKGHFNADEFVEIPAHAAIRFKPVRRLKLAVAKLVIG